MASPQDATEVVPYLTSAATIVFIQSWLKEHRVYQQFVAAFPGADKYAHWIVAAVMSLAAATGIHWVWDGSWNDFVSGHGVSVTITIPMASVVLHGLSDWFKVYVLQSTIYNTVTTKQAALRQEVAVERPLVVDPTKLPAKP